MLEQLRQAKLDRLLTKNNNLNGRRVVSAGNAQNPQDYTTLSDVRKLISSFKQVASGGFKSVSYMAHKFVQYIDSNGNPVLAQPAFSDLSGNINTTQLPVGYKIPTNVTDRTSVYALNTPYQNSNAYPIYPFVSWSASGTIGITVTIDTVNPPVLYSIIQRVNSNSYDSVSFIVPPYYWYKITPLGTPTLQKWIEIW